MSGKRLGHRLGLGILRPFKVSSGMCPAQRVRHLPGALRRAGRIRLVAVAEQRAAVLTEKLVHMTVRARRRVVKHHLLGIAVHRPQPPGAHLALRRAPRFERGLVHRQHPTREPMRTLRIGKRRQQVDGAARPVHQSGATERDTRVEKTLMLTIQRKMPAELVDEHRTKETHVGARALQHIRRRRGGEHRLAPPALDDWAHVLQHHVAARLLRKAIAHLLADDLALGLRNRFNRRVRDLDGLNRHLGTEAQPALLQPPRRAPSPDARSSPSGSAHRRARAALSPRAPPTD